MNQQPMSVVSEHDAIHYKLANYVIGFVGCLVLTFVSYFLVTHHITTKAVTVGIISVLAVVQFLVQMVLFLHINEEKQPRWRLMALLFMLSIVLVVVFGSLWIMNNLNYRMMMSPEQQTQYLKSQDSL